MVTSTPASFEIDIDGDEFELEFQATQEAEGKRAEAAAIASGKIPILSIDGGNHGTANIRYLVPWKGGANCIVHMPDREHWKEAYVCPGEFGLDCKICDPILKEIKRGLEDGTITVPEGQSRDPRKILKRTCDAYSDKKRILELFMLWPVWDYEAGDDNKGAVRIMAYKPNAQSPLNAIHKQDYKMFVHPPEGATPIPLTEYDIELEQFLPKKGKDWDYAKRQIVPSYSPPTPFQFQDKVDEFKKRLLEGTGRDDWGPMDFRLGYALFKAQGNLDYAKQLQVVRQRLTGISVEEEKPAAKEEEQPTRRKSRQISMNVDEESLE